jgi:hypothetical protein
MGPYRLEPIRRVSPIAPSTHRADVARPVIPADDGAWTCSAPARCSRMPDRGARSASASSLSAAVDLPHDLSDAASRRRTGRPDHAGNDRRLSSRARHLGGPAHGADAVARSPHHRRHCRTVSGLELPPAAHQRAAPDRSPARDKRARVVHSSRQSRAPPAPATSARRGRAGRSCPQRKRTRAP